MSAETSIAPSTVPKTEAKTSDFNDLPESELDGLIERIEQAREHNLALSGDDYALLLNAVLTLASMQEQLSYNDLTIHKLKKLLGVVRSSEKLRDLVPAEDENSKPSSTKGPSARAGSKSRSKPKPSPIKPSIHRHALEGLNKGDACPGCHAGKVYKYAPALLLRIVGHAPLSSERHVCDQLRCNGCGEIFSAELPEHVKADGRPNQQYGYSARSVMSIYKYFAGSPFYRQESVIGLLGGHIAASSVFDQCEHVANALNPVFKAIKAMAADASLFYLDDTTNRILMQKPVIKIRGGKERLRTGIFTSACLAIMSDQRRIVLFQTNVGHAGEWMEEILRARDPNKDPPLIMSDALSANQVIGTTTKKALYNAHGRRGFAELSEQHLDEVIFALEQYQHAWINEHHCAEQALSDDDRLVYHQEHSLPHMHTLLGWCEEQLASDAVESNSNLGRAMRYFIRHYEGLTTFCRLPGAPVDNNEIERLIKLIVRARKNSLFFKTLVGADISDVITSVLATCHKQNINAFDYLNAVQRNQLAVKASPEKWLPWNYPQS
jgi:transposase